MSYRELEKQQAVQLFALEQAPGPHNKLLEEATKIRENNTPEYRTGLASQIHDLEKNLPAEQAKQQESEIFTALGVATVEQNGSITFVASDDGTGTPIEKAESNLKKFGPLSKEDWATLDSLDVTKAKMPEEQYNNIQAEIKQKINEFLAQDGQFMGLSHVSSTMDRKRNRPDEVVR